MKIKILILLFIIAFNSCNYAEKDPFNQEKILNIKNVTSSEIKVLLIKNGDTLPSLLPPNSRMELIGLMDSCNSFEQSLKSKIDYFSYQKEDNELTVLIDKESNKYLTDLDIIKKSIGTFTYSSNENDKANFKRVVVNYPIE